MKTIRHIQTILQKTGSRILRLFSLLGIAKKDSRTVVSGQSGVLFLRLLIQPDEVGGVCVKLLDSQVKQRIGKPQILKVEVETASMPSDKWGYLTLVREGILEWQGYLSKSPKEYCENCGQPCGTPPVTLHSPDSVIYNILLTRPHAFVIGLPEIPLCPYCYKCRL